jgi:hypothetical protein
MWVLMNDSFLSIVCDPARPTELLVRARKRADIAVVFPEAKISLTPKRDYRWRTYLPRRAVAKAIAAQVRAIDYPNFKNSVTDPARHTAYSRIWHIMWDWALAPARRPIAEPVAQPDLPWWQEPLSAWGDADDQDWDGRWGDRK